MTRLRGGRKRARVCSKRTRNCRKRARFFGADKNLLEKAKPYFNKFVEVMGPWWLKLTNNNEPKRVLIVVGSGGSGVVFGAKWRGEEESIEGGNNSKF